MLSRICAGRKLVQSPCHRVIKCNWSRPHGQNGSIKRFSPLVTGSLNVTDYGSMSESIELQGMQRLNS